MTMIFGATNTDAAGHPDSALAMAAAAPLRAEPRTIDLDNAFLGAASPFGASGVFGDGRLALAMDGRPQLAGSAQGEPFWEAFRRAYALEGEAVVERIRGPFALALFDASDGTTLLAVDRMGIRPLAYRTTGDNGVIFGSAVTSIAAHPAAATRISLQALYDYVYFHTVPSPACIFEGIRKLEPGTLFLCRDGRHSVERYWRPVRSVSHDLDGLQSDLRETIHQAVQRADPEAESGAFLSGGLDSSTVCGMLREIRGEPIPAYTISFAAERYDETAYAEDAARHFGLDFRTYSISPEDIAASIPRIAAAYDEPFGNSSAAAVDYCAALARRSGTRVLLAGDGGDELFAGNERYAKQQMFETYLRLPAAIRKGVIEPIAARGDAPLRKVRNFVARANMEMPLRMQPFNLLNVRPPAEIFEPHFLEAVGTDHPRQMLRDVYASEPDLHFLRRMLFVDWKFTLADNDLRKVNRMCEIHSVEARYPLLDEAVVDLSLRVPEKQLIRRGELRWFYRRSLRDFLPPSTLEKKKHGFGLPFGVWLASSTALQSQVLPALDSLKARRIFRAAFLDELLKRARERNAEPYYGNNIWPLVLLEHWLTVHAPTFSV